MSILDGAIIIAVGSNTESISQNGGANLPLPPYEENGMVANLKYFFNYDFASICDWQQLPQVPVEQVEVIPYLHSGLATGL